MSANTNDPDDDTAEKVPEDLAKAFDEAATVTEGPARLIFEHTDVADMHRESDNKMVGKVHYCPTYDCLAYYSQRWKPYHYMFEYDGFAINDDILQSLDEMGVEKVFIGVMNTSTVLEFNLEQYLDEPTFDEGFGLQRCAPDVDAVREWPNAVDNLFDE